MKQSLFCLVFLLPFFSAAQSNWLYTAGSGGNDETLDALKSTNNKIYSTGYYSQTAMFGALPLTPFGAGDVFVSCQSATGDYLWVKRAGGTGGDRGTAIARSPGGNIIVAGFYSGSAQFDATTINSVSGSQDLFVASYNENTGVLNWVQSFGGDGIEVPYDVCTDQLNNIIVTGQFKGTAAFGSSTFSSMTDVSSGVQGYDIFVLKISPLGSVIWAKQGKASHDDRGMCLATDNSNNIYLTGQFSDTLTFTNVYINSGYNKSFLMKMGPSGNELWFNRILGSYVTVYGLEASKVSSAIYLCGDFSGTLNYKNGSSNYVTSAFTKKIFVVKTDQSGGFSWGRSLGSGNDLSCRDLFVDNTDNVFLTGYFKCAFTELSQTYGSGLFNSVGFKDVFVTKYNAMGVNQWHNHFGGTGEDIPYTIFDDNAGNPLVAGGFEKHINIPVLSGAYLTNLSNDLSIAALGPNAGATVCGSADYGSFVSSASEGHKDIFTALPVNTARPLYDYFQRTGPSCTYDTLVPFVVEDTVSACTDGTAHLHLNTGSDNAIGPDYVFDWSPGAGATTMTTSIPGWHTVDFSYADGCRTFHDSVYMKIQAAFGVPEIFNTGGFMHLAIPLAGCDNKLSMLNTDSVYLIVTNAPAGYNVIWETPSGFVYNDSVLITTPGDYYATIQSPDALCGTSTCITVDFWYLVTGDAGNANTNDPFEIHFADSLADATDTIRVCERGFFEVRFVDSVLYANGIPTFLPLFVHWDISGGFAYNFPLSYPYTYNIHNQVYQAFSSGPCTITCKILHPLDGSILLAVTRNFYLEVIENPLDDLVLSGAHFLCPSDTVQLHASGWTGLTWTGPGIVLLEGDSLAHVNATGLYSVSASYYDAVSGCAFDTTLFTSVHNVPQPLITLVPSNGVICPLDSVHLIAEPAGSDYVWYGPLGSVGSTSDNIYASTPGNYYYSYTDHNGCPLVSETVELNEYSTPSILVDPGLQICPGEEVLLEVDAIDGSLISWGAPFSDSALTHTVNTPGIYTCVITSCGIVTGLSVEIVTTSVSAEIVYNGPMVVCPADTVLLYASGSAYEFTWNEGTVAPVLETLGGGSFILTASDESGCTASDTIVIAEASSMQTPSSFDTTVCRGSTVSVHISGADTLHWFTDPALEAFHTGHDLYITEVDSTLQFLVQSSDTACASDYALVNIYVNPSSLAPVIAGDSILCAGEALLLSAPGIFGLDFSWTGPGGFSTNTATVSITDPGPGATGWYVLTVSDSLCTSAPDSVYVTANYSPGITLTASGDTAICPGDTLVLGFSPSLTSFVWSNGNSTDSLLYVTAGGIYSLTGTDFSGCLDTSLQVEVTIAPLPPAPILNDTLTCKGGSVVFVYSGTISWYNGVTGVFISSATGSFTTGSLSSDMTYTIVQVSPEGCQSAPSEVNIDVDLTLPAPVIVPPDTIVCEGEEVSFEAVCAYTSLLYSWTGPGFFGIPGNPWVIPSAGEENEGLYSVHYKVGNCISAPATVTLTVISLEPFTLSDDSVLCTGHFLQLAYPDGEGQTYLWNGSIPNNITISSAGIYVLTALSPEGCSVSDSISITEENCGSDEVNVFTPNGDGINDMFTFDKFTMPVKEMQVYDRWGVLMNRISPPASGWDGRTFEDREAVEGVYYYVVIVLDEWGSEQPLTGFVHLFR